MLDPRAVADDPEAIQHNLRRRHADDEAFAAVDRIVALSSRRNVLVTDRDGCRAARNSLSKAIGDLFKAGKRDEAEAMKAEVATNNARIAELEAELDGLEVELRHLALSLPNVLDPSVPDGHSDADNPVVATWGTPRAFDFTPKAHVEVGEALGILDLERAAKLTGARFSVLKGLGARLERALMNFFLDLHTGTNGYTEVMVPYMVHADICEGTGQLPKFAGDMFKLAEPVNGQDTYLIPTAEVPVTNLHREEILDDAQLPVKMVCFTPCFRSEAGSAGRDVRGLIRVHQFHKVELVWLTRPEDSADAHEQLVSHAEQALQALELPYRKVLLCAGDTGFGAARCYDLEVWLPSQQAFREVSSCSNFHDFQARRMNLRYRPADVDGKKSRPQFAHTLNGSGLPLGRVLVAILENHQQADGSVVVPEVLRPYVGTDVIRPPSA
ncbi:MAG: serine--tRNA ligase [Alphaproteobacteria bacterium]|nr:serine--tRNA ligase [Alphaproteobacteria bacterium]